MRNRLCLIMCLVNLTMGVVVQAQETKTITLNEVIQTALESNPELKAAQAKFKASQNRIKSSSSLPDPIAGLEYLNVPQGTLKLGEAEMKMYTVSQEIPWPTKLSLRGKISRSDVDITEQEYKAKERKIIAQVKQAYFKIYEAYQSIDTMKETIQLLGQMLRVSERKYSTRKAGLSDVLKIQVELAKLNNELITLENQKQTHEAKLNSLLNRQSLESVGRPSYTQAGKFEPAINELYNLAKINRPELLQAKAGIRRSEQGLTLAKKEYLPDFMVTYKQRVLDGDFMGWDGMLNMTVPLWFWRKQSSMVKEMHSELSMSQADYKAMENMVLFEVKEMYLRVDAAWRKVELSKNTIIPQTQQVLRISQRGYEADQVEFLDMLDSERMYLEARLDYYMNIVDYEMAKAELEQMIGVDLTEVKK